MKKIAVYTSVFGNYDELVNPTCDAIVKNVDFICFTDSNIKSDTWNIVKQTKLYDDPNRCAKKYKILPHRYLSGYDVSIWIDANYVIREDVNEYINTVLKHPKKIAFFDHSKTFLDPRDCIYEEAEIIFYFGKKNGNYKDDPEIIRKQILRYKQEGYPAHNGLICGTIITRKHNDPEVIKTMEDWWTEIKYNSKRDQLSFNYIAWKNNFEFSYVDVEGDVRENKWFVTTGPHAKKRIK